MPKPDPTPIIMMVLSALRYYKIKYAADLLAIISARVCDEMNIDRKRFCDLVIAEPKKATTTTSATE
jgi:hypothetical protein